MTTPTNTPLSDVPGGVPADACAREIALLEILEVISRSRADEMPVLKAIVHNAARLCDATLAGLSLVNEARTHLKYACIWGADQGIFKIGYEFDLNGPLQVATTIRESRVIHTADLADDPLYVARDPVRVKIVEEAGVRTFLTVPLIKDGVAFGCLNLNRFEVRPFSDADIALVQTFAEQAVIAIENVRQYRELQTRLERERASKDILDVISRSRDDETPVFNIILENAARLCHASHAFLMLRNEANTHLEFVAESFVKVSSIVDLKDQPYAHDEKNSLTVEALNSAQVRHVPDLLSHAVSYSTPMMARAIEKEGMRTLLYVPLLKDGRALGLIGVYKHKVAPFDDGEIEMVETFAEQAVIAIENVRQFREVQERLEREEATREILQVISSSRSDTAPVFEVILRNAARLCGAPMADLDLVDDDGQHLREVASWGAPERFIGQESGVWRLDSQYGNVVATRERRVVHIADITDTKRYRAGDPKSIEAADVEGIRTVLAVPLVSGERGLGCIMLFRREIRPFMADEIELVRAFAEQAVIAIENARQFKALENRTAEVVALNSDLEDRVEAQVSQLERLGRLKRFLSPQVADAVVSSGDDNLLGSHRAMIAILFCDIRGFTAFCESAEPEETIEVLQTFHETLGKLIHQAGAGFDHRAGDGIMVVFNDPVPCDDPVGAALRVAIAMREHMVELCGKWRKLGHKMGFGVGISLGYATVGMVGFEGRYDYTASGTAVNLAARLCDQAADQEILLSQRAATALEDIAEVESAGELTLKGFHAPVDVFRVTEMKETQ